MSDHADDARWQRADESPDDAGDVDAVESYEVDGGVVFYDAYNPLAWVEAQSAVLLREYA